MGTWVFAEQRREDVRREPREAEWFRTPHTAEGEYPGTVPLVREVLQNALDARHGNGPVRVRFAVHEAWDAPEASRLAYYFARLGPALVAMGVDVAPEGVPRLPCRFLVVEDFGTRGLEGDPRLSRDPAPGRDRDDFYWFWRNIGRSGKTGDDLGRWGLGKTAYRAASRARCMLGLTVRASDHRALLMGQAVLRIHEHEGCEFKPEGWWCDGQDRHGLPLPIEEAGEIARFREDWRLSRRSEPGLSIVVPFIPDDLRAEGLLQAVAAHFFVSILRHELEVEIAGGGLGVVQLDEQNLEAACRRVTWDGLKRTKRHVPPPVAFARSCLRRPPEIATGVLGRDRVPELDEAALSGLPLPDLRERFAAGELVGLRIRLALPRRDSGSESGAFDVYIQRRADGQPGESYYVREGMTIPAIGAQASRRGVQSLVLVDRGPLAQLLGDTEGPAHEDWNESAELPEALWKRGWKGRVRFVRRSVDALVEVLAQRTAPADFDALREFFAVPPAPPPEGRPSSPGPGGPPPVGPVPPAPPPWFHVSARAGGFRIARHRGVPMPDEPRLRVSMAYDLARGNPLDYWTRLDFDLRTGRGARIAAAEGVWLDVLDGNVLLLRDLAEHFAVVIEGFDPHRDLFVRVDDESARPGEQHDQAGELHGTAADPA
jgi:hypothetical protein